MVAQPTAARHPVGCPLHPRELATVRLLADGLSYAQIAERLDRSESTVRGTVNRINRRLGTVSSAQAVLHCAQLGLIDDWEPASGEDIRLQRRAVIAIEALVEAVKRQRLTSRQHTLLDALHDTLKARSDDAKIEARRDLDAAFNELMDEAGVHVRGNRSPRDLLELLHSHILGARA